MTRIHGVLACGLLLALVSAAPALADSITFIRENNVWLANGDGTGQYQVTFDGAPGSPYESPSQSDGGAILAVRRPPGQRNQLFRMTQSGGLLNPPVDTPAPGPGGAIDAKISPDGTLAAYWFVTLVNGEPLCPFCVEVTSRTLITRSDRFTGAEEVGTPHTGVQPSWISNSTLLMSNSNGTQWYYTLGMKEAVQWFENGGVLTPPFETISDSEVAPSGDRIILVYGDHQDSLWMLKLNGPPPAEPSAATKCFVEPKGKFVDPTWRSDGGRVYWQEDDGVWSAPIAGPTTCGAEPALMVPGGREPDASPAAVNPGPRPGCGNPGNPAACPPVNPPGPGPETHPHCPCAATLAQLEGLLKEEARALSKLKLRGLRTKGRLSLTAASALPGTLTARLLVGSGAHPRVLAEGRHVYAKAGRASLVLATTKQGRRLLRHARRLRVTLKLTFVAAGSTGLTSAQRVLALR